MCLKLLSFSTDPAHIYLPGVHRVAPLLKRWLPLTHHQGAVSDKHLDYYLDEFTSFFNRRPSRKTSGTVQRTKYGVGWLVLAECF